MRDCPLRRLCVRTIHDCLRRIARIDPIVIFRISKRFLPYLLAVVFGLMLVFGYITYRVSENSGIEALADSEIRARIKPRANLTVVPTSGEPLGGAKPQFASTDLAERLSARAIREGRKLEGVVVELLEAQGQR